MQVVELILLRHGETDYNRQQRVQGWRDVPLTGIGRAQARAVAVRLAEAGPFDHFVTSDLIRAAETARIIGEAVGMTPEVDSAWRECNLGAWEGKTLEEVEALSPTRQSLGRLGLDACPHGGESRRQLQVRVTAAAEALAQRFPEGRVLVVTHGGPIRLLVGSVLGLDESGLAALVADSVSIHRVEWTDPGWRVLGLNDTCHWPDD